MNVFRIHYMAILISVEYETAKYISSTSIVTNYVTNYEVK